MIDNRKRVTVYVNKENYKKLKALLALEGSSVSAFVRKAIRAYLNEKTEEVMDEMKKDAEAAITGIHPDSPTI